MSDQVLGLEELNRLTTEALEDVDFGRVIDHEAIRTWADKLIDSIHEDR